MTTGTIKIRQYMRQNLKDHRDPITDEINMTFLAEDAVQHFDDFDGNDIPEVYFDCAAEVAEQDESRRSGRVHRAISGIIDSADSSYF